MRPAFTLAVLVAAAGALGASDGAAQQAAGASGTTDRPSLLGVGVTGGWFDFGGGRTQTGLGAVVELRPTSWLTLSANPSYAFARDSVDKHFVTRQGLADLPVTLGIWRTFDAATLSPSVALSIGATVPVGDSASGIGYGRSFISVSGGLGFSPSDRTSLYVGGGRGLSSVLGSEPSTYVDVEGSASLTDRLTLNLSGSSDVGRNDPAEPRYQALGGGLSLRLWGDWSLTLFGSRGLGDYTADRSLSIGFGTAFAGLMPVGPVSSFNLASGGAGDRTSTAEQKKKECRAHPHGKPKKHCA